METRGKSTKFEKIFFSESQVSSIVTEPTKLSFVAENIGVLVGHPWHSGNNDVMYLPTPMRVTFKHPSRSVRKFSPYPADAESNDWPPSHTIEDGPFIPGGKHVTTFGFETALLEPPAYVDWEIDAESFEIEPAGE